MAYSTVVLELTKYPQFVQLYAEQHNLYCATVEKYPMINAAAVLEYRVRTGELTVYEARKRFVAQYKKTNVIPSSAIKVRAGLDTFRASVIEMIHPLPCCKSGLYVVEKKKHRRTDNE